MTETMLDRKHQQAARIIFVLLMGLSVIAAFSLLKWAINGKMARTAQMAESDITAELREKQLTCLARNIYYEAGSEPFEGKIAVAQVTINRTESGRFPKDVCQTIYQKNVFYERVVCQFSWYCDKAATVRPVHKGNYEESMVAAKKVLLEGFRLPSLEKALYYHADYVDPKWGKERVAKIGRHIFYK